MCVRLRLCCITRMCMICMQVLTSLNQPCSQEPPVKRKKLKPRCVTTPDDILLPINPTTHSMTIKHDTACKVRDICLSCLITSHFFIPISDLQPDGLNLPCIDLVMQHIYEDTKSYETCHTLSWARLRFHTVMMPKLVMKIHYKHEFPQKRWLMHLLTVAGLMSNSYIIKCLMSTVCGARATLLWLITSTSCLRNSVTHTHHLIMDLTTERDQRLIPRRFPHINTSQTSL